MENSTRYIISRDAFHKELKELLVPYNSDALSSYGETKVSLDAFLKDKMLIVATIRQGVSWSLFSLIQKALPFSLQDWSDMMDVSYKTLLRYKSSGRSFKHAQSERIIEVAEVSKLGLEVFGSMESFKRWLYAPSFALGGQQPVELLRDSYGKELVLRELHHIDHGIFA